MEKDVNNVKRDRDEIKNQCHRAIMKWNSHFMMAFFYGKVKVKKMTFE